MCLGEDKVHPKGSFTKQDACEKTGKRGAGGLSGARLAGAEWTSLKLLEDLFIYLF